MTLMKVIRKRRSTREYAARPVPADQVDLLLEAALRAPSSMGRRPWEIVVVTDPACLATLAQAKPQGAALLQGAPLAFVVCADPDISDVWVEDCAVLCTFVQLAAESLGLGSCWVQIRKRTHDPDKTAATFVAETVALPSHLDVAAIVAVGYPAATKPPHPASTLPWHKVHRERF